MIKLEFHQFVSFLYHDFIPSFSSSATLVPRALRRDITTYDAPVLLDDIDCDGSESSLLDCSDAGYVNVTGCTSIAVAQCEGDYYEVLCSLTLFG